MTATTGRLVRCSAQELANRVTALATLQVLLWASNFEDSRTTPPGNLPPSSARGPAYLLGTGAPDQVSSTAHSRQAIRWGGGGGSPNPPSLLAGRG